MASRFWGPKITGSRLGIPTSRARLHTIFATAFEFAMCRNNNRSKAYPTSGPITTTETRNASNPDQFSFCVR